MGGAQSRRPGGYRRGPDRGGRITPAPGPGPGAGITPGDWNAALDAFADATIRIDGRGVSFDVPPGADPDADAAPSTSAVAAAAAAGAYLGDEKLAARVEGGNALEELARAAEDFLAAPLTATARKKTMDARREVAARVAAGTRLVGAAVAGARSSRARDEAREKWEKSAGPKTSTFNPSSSSNRSRGSFAGRLEG